MSTPEWLTTQLNTLTPLTDDPEEVLAGALCYAQIHAINVFLARTEDGLPFWLLFRSVANAHAAVIAALTRDVEGDDAEEEPADAEP